MQKIMPCLWFDSNAEEAVGFYTSIFKKSKIINKSYYGKESYNIHGRSEGSVMTIEFEILGQKFIALNGGPVFNFNEAVSFIINCKNQKEIDYYWERLGDGSDKNSQQCGWLKDKYGVSWQVVPSVLSEMLRDPEKEKKETVIKTMLEMKKIDMEKLIKAYESEEHSFRLIK